MKLGKIDSLTSLRFFAAALIVIFHSRHISWDFEISRHFVLPQAVSLFFVLSGFILAYTNSNLRNWNDTRRFYVGRFSRIWPLHVVCAIPAYFMIKIDGGATSLSDALLNISLLQSWVPDVNSFFSLNGVSWSLSVEAFFYAMFPLITLNRARHWKSALAATFVLTVSILVVSGFLQPETVAWSAVLLPATRLFEFVLGIAAYKLVETPLGGATRSAKWRWTAFEAAAISLCIVFAWFCDGASLNAFPIHLSRAVKIYLGVAGSSVAFAILITALAFQKGNISRILQIAPLVYLGEISFAIYMVHQLVLRFMGQHQNYLSDLSMVTKSSIYWCATLLVAAASHHLIELPCKRAITAAARKLPGNRWRALNRNC